MVHVGIYVVILKCHVKKLVGICIYHRRNLIRCC